MKRIDGRLLPLLPLLIIAGCSGGEDRGSTATTTYSQDEVYSEDSQDNIYTEDLETIGKARGVEQTLFEGVDRNRALMDEQAQ